MNRSSSGGSSDDSSPDKKKSKKSKVKKFPLFFFLFEIAFTHLFIFRLEINETEKCATCWDRTNDQDWRKYYTLNSSQAFYVMLITSWLSCNTVLKQKLIDETYKCELEVVDLRSL